MEKVEIRDDDGSILQMKRYKGRLFGVAYPDDVEGRNKELNSIGFTKDDVLISSYPKSGTHWIMELAHMVLRRSADYITESIPLFDITPVPDLKKMFESAEGPRLFPTHLPANLLPQKITEKKVRIVHIYRNPKDVAVSFFTFIKKLKMFEGYKNAQWKNFISHFMDGEVPSGDWFSHLKDWTDFKKENPDYPILFLCYEDMKEDPHEAVRKLVKFVDAGIDEKLIAEVVQKCDFKNLTSHKNSNMHPNTAKLTDLKENVFYRKGEVGDWKNWFTVAQNEEFDRRMEPLLKTLDMKCRYSL